MSESVIELLGYGTDFVRTWENGKYLSTWKRKDFLCLLKFDGQYTGKVIGAPINVRGFYNPVEALRALESKCGWFVIESVKCRKGLADLPQRTFGARTFNMVNELPEGETFMLYKWENFELVVEKMQNSLQAIIVSVGVGAMTSKCSVSWLSYESNKGVPFYKLDVANEFSSQLDIGIVLAMSVQREISKILSRKN